MWDRTAPLSRIGGVSAPAIATRASGGLVAEALIDLRADFDELLFLCHGAEAELEEARVELDAVRECAGTSPELSDGIES